MMSTEMATTSALASAGGGPITAQTMNATTAMTSTAEHEPARDLVGQLLDGRARARGLAHHLHDAREQRVRPDRSARIRNEPVWFTVPASDLDAGALLDRYRLAGEHRLVDAGVPSVTTPSTGIFAPGFTRRMSPACTSSRGTSCLDRRPAATRNAVVGASFSRSAMALDVLDRARSSST